MAGEAVATVEVSDYVFAEPMNGPLLHQAVVAQQANRRQGTHSVRTRGQVVHSNRKLRAQKGSGRARLGDAGNPGLRGGGSHTARTRGTIRSGSLCGCDVTRYV